MDTLRPYSNGPLHVRVYNYFTTEKKIVIGFLPLHNPELSKISQSLDMKPLSVLMSREDIGLGK